MAGKRQAADAAGGVAKKRPVVRPCRLCPAEAKTRSEYGRLDETDKWTYFCCTGCYHKLKEEGKDVSDLIADRKAKKLKDGATPPPTVPPPSAAAAMDTGKTSCRVHQGCSGDHSVRLTVRSACCLIARLASNQQ
jgi:hypothetical protein